MFLAYHLQMTFSTLFQMEGSIIAYADDTTCIVRNPSIENTEIHASKALGTIAKWFRQNKLKLNETKTKFMLFSNSQNSVQAFPTVLQAYEESLTITRVKKFKLLGVNVDSQMTWDTHVCHLASRLSRSLAILKKLKGLLED